MCYYYYTETTQKGRTMSDLPPEPLIDELWQRALLAEIEQMLDDLEQEILDNANNKDTTQ